MLKKILVLSLIGVGIYLLLSRRKAYAEEVSEIPSTPQVPSTPQAPDNPAISMVDQMIKEIEEKHKIVTPAPEEIVSPINLIQLSSTIHSYRGTGGEKSIDGSFETYQVDAQPNVEGKPISISSTCVSQHIFNKASNIVSLRYKMYGYAWYSFEGGASVSCKIEYTADGSNWLTVPGTLDNGTGGHGYMGKGTISDLGEITKTVNITGCLGIRASVICSASDRDGWVATDARIYEIQAIGIP